MAGVRKTPPRGAGAAGTARVGASDHTGRRAAVLVIFGTRPEAIKLVPVIRALVKDGRMAVRIAVTGQHREMVDQILEPFGIVPEFDLDIMQPDQALNDIVARVVPKLATLYAATAPRLVIVQGDTTSAFCAALAAFHLRTPVAHVEAGLRSFDRFHPYPEESNRRMISAVADLHLAATPQSAENLLREGVRREDIVVTGNTVVDSLVMTLRDRALIEAHRLKNLGLKERTRLVLITLHRRESWIASRPAAGGRDLLPLEEVLMAIRVVAAEFPDALFVYPVHKNPRVQEPARRLLEGCPNVRLLDPLAYIPFVDLMARSTVILTDSGGIQEEAPSLGVPVLVARETTERPEGVACGNNRLIGTTSAAIARELRLALRRPRGPRATPPLPNPYGDGCAGRRIVTAIQHLLGEGGRPEEFQVSGLPASAASTLRRRDPAAGRGAPRGRRRPR